MISLRLATCLILAILSIISTALGLISSLLLGSKNSTLRSLPLSNPYPVPGTPITLNFVPEQREPELSEDDVLACLFKAGHAITDHIALHGDGPIAGNHIHIASGAVELGISPVGHPVAPLTYNETLCVLSGFATKMATEGFVQRFAMVHLTEGMVWIADALVSELSGGVTVA